jgi:hypothetical protein
MELNAKVNTRKTIISFPFFLSNLTPFNGAL